MSLTRRDLLRAGLGGAGVVCLSGGSPELLVRPAAGATDRDDRDTVLVMLQLSGGNDGLNTIVPYGDDEYYRNRPTIAMAAKDVHKIDSHVGFHPRMEAMLRLYEEGYLSIVRGVGYANSNRDHARAMEILHTADPGEPNRQTGWLGRAVDSVWDENGADAQAVFVGPIARPFVLNAENAVVPAIDSLEELTIQQKKGRQPIRNERSSDNDLLDFVRRASSRALSNSKRIKAVAEAPESTSEYPPLKLAGHLRTVAQLIRAEVGIRIFLVEIGGGGIGGFDNHANQRGNHCALLEQLSESVAAFVDDLKRDKLLDRVLLMTFSEFGRTLKENGRRGTDHGAAGPILVVGSEIKGGLIGPQPSLTDLDNGALRFHTDFRRLYATVLDRWLGFDSKAVLDRQYESVDILNT